jgi:hypothetical protein
MNLAQFLLIGIVLFLVWSYFSRVRSGASDRLFLLGFGIVMIIIILQPSLATDVANFLGIGRGADLLLYLFSLFVVFCLILIYQKLRALDRTNTQIVRALSIMTARQPKMPPDPDNSAERDS